MNTEEEKKKQESEYWLTCERCGKCAPDVEEVIDPWMHEMFGKTEYVVYCHECHIDACQSV